MRPTQPNELKPRLSTCGIGPIRSTFSGRTKARTELVPRMNINAMIGAAMITESAILRAGARHSPATMATYSKPVRAPSASLLKIFRLRSESAGIAIASGRYTGNEPRARLKKGKRMSVPNVATSITPPALCTHLPSAKPRIEAVIIAKTRAQLVSVINHLLLCIQEARGPSA